MLGCWSAPVEVFESVVGTLCVASIVEFSSEIVIASVMTESVRVDFARMAKARIEELDSVSGGAARTGSAASEALASFVSVTRLTGIMARVTF